MISRLRAILGLLVGVYLIAYSCYEHNILFQVTSLILGVIGVSISICQVGLINFREGRYDD